MEKFQSNEKQEKTAQKEKPPFTELDFTRHGNSSLFYAVPGVDDRVVRKSFVNVKEKDGVKMNTHEKAEYLRNKTVQFKKIIDTLPVTMAKTEYIIGASPTNGSPAIFGVTELIDGKSLDDIPVLDKETAEKMDDIYAKIVAHLIDSYEQNDYFWYDPLMSQFMYGKAPGDTEPKVYLIDVDPNIVKWDDPELGNEYPFLGKEELLQGRLNLLAREATSLKKKTSDPTAFSKTRNMLALLGVKMPVIS